MKAVGLGAVLAAAVCISLSNIMSPVVYAAGTSVTGLLLARFAVFPILCFAIITLQNHSLRLPARDRAICFGAGLFYCAGHGSLIASFAFLPVGLGVLILFTFPFVTLIIESILDRKPPKALRVLCMLCAFAGLGLAMGVDASIIDFRGVAFAGLASLCVSTAFVWTGRTLHGIEPTVMTFYMSLSGVVLATISALLFGTFAIAVTPFLAALAMLGAVLTFNGAMLGMFTGVRFIGAAPTAMLMNLEPVFTLVLAFVVLGETLEPLQIIGAALVIGAVAAAQRFAQTTPMLPDD